MGSASCDGLESIDPAVSNFLDFPLVNSTASLAGPITSLTMDGIKSKSIGMIGMGDMGKLYTTKFSEAGWR